jgi:hypothetical protein
MRKPLYGLLVCLLTSAAAFGLSEREVSRGAIPSLALGGKEVSYTIYAPAGMERGAAFPMVVYLRNLPVERIGAAPDDEIIDGFLKSGMLVTVVDYRKQAMGRNGQFIHDEFVWLYTTFGAMNHSPLLARSGRQGAKPVNIAYGESKLTFKARDGMEYQVNPDWVYVIPEGYTVHRDLEVMRLPYPAPRDRIRLDLWAPAKPRRPVPLVLEISVTATGPQDKEMLLFYFNTPYPSTYAFFGYAVGIMGFVCPDPKKGDGREVGLDFPEHKALRLLRARKSEWGLSGKIGLMGMSKSSSRALLTAAKRPGQASALGQAQLEQYPYSVFYRKAMPEWLVKEAAKEIQVGLFPYQETEAYRGVYEERDLGPYAKESDCPDVIHCSAGGPMEFPYVIPYVTDKLPPTIFNIGMEDGSLGYRPGQHSAIFVRDALQAAGVKKLLYIEQEGLGHVFNHLRFDEFKAFFDAELKR